MVLKPSTRASSTIYLTPALTRSPPCTLPPGICSFSAALALAVWLPLELPIPSAFAKGAVVGEKSGSRRVRTALKLQLAAEAPIPRRAEQSCSASASPRQLLSLDLRRRSAKSSVWWG